MRTKPVLIFMLCTLLLLNGCSAQKLPQSPNQSDKGSLNLTLAGGATAGVWYMVTNAISECISKSYPGSVTTLVPGSATGNPPRINKGEVGAGLSTSTILFAANQGTGPFNEKLDNLASVAFIYPASLQIVVREDLGVKSFKEVIDKKMKIRLSIDQQGSEASGLFIHILEEYGTSEKEFLSWGGQLVKKGQDEASGMYVDGTIDGFILLTIYPAPAIQQGDLGRDMVLLPLDTEIIDTLCQKYGYSKLTIPADAYRFTAQATPTVSSNTVLTVPKNAPDEVAYKLVRSIIENLDYFRNVHVGLKSLTPEIMANGLGIPLHPGAEKYYQEIGALK